MTVLERAVSIKWTISSLFRIIERNNCTVWHSYWGSNHKFDFKICRYVREKGDDKWSMSGVVKSKDTSNVIVISMENTGEHRRKEEISYFSLWEIDVIDSCISYFLYLILRMSLLIYAGPGRRWRHSMVTGNKISNYNATTKQWCVALELWRILSRQMWNKFDFPPAESSAHQKISVLSPDFFTFSMTIGDTYSAWLCTEVTEYGRVLHLLVTPSLFL